MSSICQEPKKRAQQKMDNSGLSIVDSFSDIVIEPSLREGFMLGDILVFPNKGVIVRQQEHHHLSPRAMEVLFVLGCNAGSVVSRNALLGYVFGDKASAKSNLSPVMKELRHLLNDRTECPTYIQTLPRKGYRLLLPALPLDESILSADLLRVAAHLDDSPKSAKKFTLLGGIDYWRTSRLFKVAGTYIVMAWVLMQVLSVTLPVFNAARWFDKAALLALIIGFPLILGYNWWAEFKLRKHFVRKHNKTAAIHISHHAYRDLSYISILSICSLVLAIFLTEQLLGAHQVIEQNDQDQQASQSIHAQFFPNAVAVMPFTQLGRASPDYQIGLLQSEVLSFLSQSSQLRVISERVLADLPANTSLSDIRQWTGAKYVLEGKISQQGENVNIITTLTDSESGHQIWANKTLVPLTDQLTLYETISHQVLNALTFLMPQDESARLQFRPTEDIHAYDFYVRAKALLKDAYNGRQLEEAEQLFLKALSRDSKFELAQAGLCQTYLEQYNLMLVSQVFELARQACQNATHDRGLKAESEVALGRLYYASGEYQLAQQHFTQALQIRPDNSLGLIGQAKTMARMEQGEQAQQYFLQAIQAEPGYWRNYEQYGKYLFESGRYLDASLQFHKQSVLQPKSEEAFNNLGAAYYLNTEFDNATQSWRKALEINPSANIYSNLGTSLFFSKKFTQAAKMYQQAVNLNPGNYVFRGNLADALKYDASPQQTRQHYQAALKLAQENEKINPHDPTIKASIARYSSELQLCQQATQEISALQQGQVEDPYIYYDLALVASNCGSTEEVVDYLQKTLALGYSIKLLLSDHQFAQYQQQILQMQARLNG
jgi:tetratricopeptide (TPR) repeat protein